MYHAEQPMRTGQAISFHGGWALGVGEHANVLGNVSEQACGSRPLVGRRKTLRAVSP